MTIHRLSALTMVVSDESSQRLTAKGRLDEEGRVEPILKRLQRTTSPKERLLARHTTARKGTADATAR